MLSRALSKCTFNQNSYTECLPGVVINKCLFFSSMSFLQLITSYQRHGTSNISSRRWVGCCQFFSQERTAFLLYAFQKIPQYVIKISSTFEKSFAIPLHLPHLDLQYDYPNRYNILPYNQVFKTMKLDLPDVTLYKRLTSPFVRHPPFFFITSLFF